MLGRYLIVAGGFLQLLGLCVTFSEFLSLRLEFGRSSLIGVMTGPFRRVVLAIGRLLRRPKPVVRPLSAALEAMSETVASGRIRHDLERLSAKAARKAVRDELDQIYRSLDDAQATAEAAGAEMRADQQRDRDETKAALDKLGRLLERAAIGSPRLRGLGVVVIAVGIGFSALGSWLTAAP
jgi:hypothetical protein